jgi:hypothetical protein
MVYCKLTTDEHSQSIAHPDCLMGLNQMITKEGSSCSIFNSDWAVLDLDALEIKLKALNRRSYQYQTCDFAAGIKLNNAKKKLLVECRLNYKSANNLTSTEFNEKIDGSIAILGHTPPIHYSVYFIFTDKVKSLAIRKLRELRSNRKEFLVVTVTEFRNLFTIPCSTECRTISCNLYA